MVYVYLYNNLKQFETDIRDLCMAFFLYKKIVFLYEDKYEDLEYLKDGNNNIVIKDFVDLNNIQFNDRIQMKNYIKRNLYYYLSKLTNKNLPWGALTGIRPVNITTQIIEYIEYGVNTQSETLKQFIYYCKKNDYIFNKKTNYKFIKKYLKYEYLISDEKADLLIAIAKKEIEILNRNIVNNYKNCFSVYIGVPFCKSTCLYCSFTSYNIDKWNNYVDKYLNKLEYELKNSKKLFPKNKKLLTLYIGGGTPTSLSNEQFEKFLNIIKNNINLNGLYEWTIEAGRPDTINEYKLNLMKKFGVDRISINPQTFNQKTLDLIGRKHTVDDIIKKYKLAKKIGFKNINMDIILGLPDEKLDEVVKTLIQIGKLKPDNLTVHSLALKRAARLNVEKNIWSDKYIATLHNDNNIENMSKCSFYLSKLLNLKPYYLYRQKNISGNLENIGFSKQNKECVYNIMMMSERHSVYAFGCKASSKIVTYKKNGEKIVKRIDGYKSIVDYVK